MSVTAEKATIAETLRTMVAFPQNSIVQAQACLTLYNFTSGGEHKALLNRVEAADQGALPAIVSAIRAHDSHRSVIQWGMRAILNIVSGADFPSIERKAKAIRSGTTSLATLARPSQLK